MVIEVIKVDHDGCLTFGKQRLQLLLLRQTTLAIWISSQTYTVHSSITECCQVLQYIYCFKLLPVTPYELLRCSDSFLIAAFSCLHYMCLSSYTCVDCQYVYQQLLFISVP